MKRIVPYLIIILSVIIFFPKIFFAGHTFISSGMVSTDLYLFNYPLKSLMHQTMLQGRGIPLWTDLIGNGYPIFAEGQMGAFYPLHLLFFALPFSTIHLFNANLMLHYILTGIFTYLYIKNCIKLSQRASVLGAFIFTFSGYMLTHLHQVNIILELTYFPLNLLIAETIIKINHDTKRSKLVLSFLILTLSLFLQMTAGHIEMVYYNLLFTGIYVVIRFFFDPTTRTKVGSKILLSVTALLVTTMLALPQLFATYELVKFSQRESGISYESTTGTLWPIETLILFINPKAYDVYRAEPGYSPNKAETVNIGALYPYVGIIPLLLTIFAISGISKKESISIAGELPRKIWTATFLTLLVFTYLYAVGRSTQLFSVVWEVIPGMKFFRFPVKAIYIIEFCLAILASIGLQKIEESIINKTKNNQTKITQKRQLLHNKTDEKIKAEEGVQGNNAGKISLATIVTVLIISVCFLDLWVFNRPTQPTIPASDWLQTPDFAEYINSQELDCNCPAQAGFRNWRSYSHGTNNIDYTRIFDFPLQKDLQNILHMDFNMIHNVALNREWAVLFLQRQTLLNRFNTQIDFDTGVLTLPPEMKKSLDLQSVRYLISDLKIDDPNLELVKTHQFSSKVNHVIFIAGSTDAKYFPTDHAYLYRNKSYYPRVTITPQSQAIYLTAQDKQAGNILQTVLSPDFDPAKQTIIEKSETVSTAAQQSETSIKADYQILSYTDQDMEIQINTDQPAYFTLADTYYPGWTATLDNREVEVLKANYAFKSVAVPAGSHRLRLSFTPTQWNVTRVIVLAGWSVIATGSIYLLINFIKSKKRV